MILALGGSVRLSIMAAGRVFTVVMLTRPVVVVWRLTLVVVD